MPRRSKDGVPGTTFVRDGLLRIRIPLGNGKYHLVCLGLPDTRDNRRYALRERQRISDELRMGKKAVLTGPPLLQDALQRFMDEKNITEKSMKLYVLSVKTVLRSVVVYDAELIEQRCAEWRKTATMKPSSVNTYLRHVAGFVRWVARKYDLKEADVRQHLLRKVRMDVKTWTHEEIAKILSDRNDPEFTLMLEFMVATGARPSDCFNLRWEDLSEDRTVTFHNRITGKRETIPVVEYAWMALMTQKKRLERDGIVREKVWRWGAKNIHNVERAFHRLLDRVGVEANGRSLKHFRKTFRGLIDDLPFTMQMALMRHSSPDVTLTNYSWVSSDVMKEAMKSIRVPNRDLKDSKSLPDNKKPTDS